VNIVQENPIIKAPTQKTMRFRVRGRYRNVELLFVSEILASLGYIQTCSNEHWDIIWTVKMVKQEFAILAPFQKVNFMPGMQFICSKNLLHQSILKSRESWLEKFVNTGNNELLKLASCNFWPVGFNLEIPAEFDALANLFETEDDLLYIIKKPFTSSGRGVAIIHSLDQLMEIKEKEEYQPLERVKPLAQEYIKDVKLFDGFKFTIRLYVAIIDVDPLVVYIYKNGLLRICSKRYSLDKETMNDDFVHIDSFAININNKTPEKVSDNLHHEGLRCDVLSYFKILEEEYSTEEVAELWKQIRELVAMSIIAAEHDISRAVASVCKQRANAFEILGYDVLIDQSLKPWLLEINHTPSLEPHTSLENDIKKNMLTDLFNLVDITSSRRLTVNTETDTIWDIIQTIQTELENGNTPDCMLYNSKLAEVDFSLFNRTAVWILVNYEHSYRHKGAFEKILPDPKFTPFTKCKERNILITNWIDAGLSILEDVYLNLGSDEEIIE